VRPITEDEIQAEIRKQADQLSTDGIETSVEMRQVMLGGPAHPIAEIAEDANADLIVAGTHGHQIDPDRWRLPHESRRGDSNP
jgi:nucleotide-binding universal stress UspA family protein